MKKTELSDATLVKLYAQGDEKAFSQLVARHKSRVYSTIYLIVKDRYVAEDLLQEVFIKVVDTIKGGRYNEEGKFAPWVVRIAHNMAIDWFRRDKRYPTVVLEDGTNVLESLPFTDSSYESRQIRNEALGLIRQFITQLPEAQREVLLLRHFAGMSFQEIADHTGVSINTALGRMRYALLNLRKKMSQTSLRYDQDFYPQ